MPTELRCHSAFSFGDGAVTPEAIVQRAAALGYDALALTDTADLGGLVRLAKAAEAQGIRAIAGAELVVDGHPAAFLAMDEEGYRNLAGLVTRARVGVLRSDEGATRPRGYPRLSWDDLAERARGLVALTGPASGEVASLLRARRRAEARQAVERWKQVFGDRLAIEVQVHHVGGEEAALAGALIELAEETGVPWVACQDPRYLDSSSRFVHDMLTALRHETTLDDAARRGLLLPNGDWRLLTPEELRRRWRGAERGLAMAGEIAARCRFDLAWMRPPLPGYPVPPGHTEDSYLRVQTFAGARERWGDVLTAAQVGQLEHELAVIQRLGFAGFFLVMWDAVRFARSRGILCQGRGSAANSAVAYCLGITAVDPVLHGLLFERFLSDIRTEGRTEAPDIDVDIEHDRREEVLDYVYGTWRRPNAAITCTVQHYRAPHAVQDAMRALGYPAELAVRISRRLHRHEPAEAAEIVRTKLGPEVGLDVTDARGRALLRAIAGFEGLPRLRATHVGGFVLSAAPLGDWLPIEETTMGRTIIQFDKDDLDDLGVPKFDFLGLGGLAMVRRAFDAIERRTGQRPSMYRLPCDDPATYELIARGDTIGTFQIESRAQIASVVQTKPDRLYDLVVQVALIRPGPIQARFVHPYVRRRRGEEPVTFALPALEPILRRTQGIPIFQEQAMAIAMALAGYSAAEADELRRTMGHQRKKDRLFAALVKLHDRMRAQGVPPDLALQIAEDLKSFANYGFPESHAWSFALIAYATAWLKAHYPTEFYLGLLNAWPMGFYSPATLIHDAKRRGVEVRPPCLAHGDWECTTEPAREQPALRLGWRFVTGIGTVALERLKTARAAGPFTSIADVMRRAGLSRADAIKLARAGAFAAWEPDRRKAAWQALGVAGDGLPLAPARPSAGPDVRPLSSADRIFLDYATTGLSIEGHPMQTMRAALEARGILGSRELAERPDGALVVVAGLVTIRQRPESAKGTVFLLLEDEHGTMNIIVNKPRVERYEAAVKRAPFLLVAGRLEKNGPVLNVVGFRFKALDARALVFRSRDFR
ncbi:MAG: DNA polymerase III subunit alpha [Gemmatimonadota bacterium]